MPKSPVFIVGSPRSGTSMLVNALLSVGYHGFREGNFLPFLGTIHKIVDRHFSVFAEPNPNVLISQVNPELLKEQIENIFKDTMEKLNATPPWFDKSLNPGMIQAIPTLRRLWPGSVFIFAKRRAIENMVSRIQKFPRHTFEYHCTDWAKNMASWREMRETLPAHAYIEIDQQDLVRKPDVVSKKLAAFLGVKNDEVKKLTGVFKSNRPQETAKGTAVKTYSLEGLPWSREQIAIFKQHCGPEMDEYGYVMDESYDKHS